MKSAFWELGEMMQAEVLTLSHTKKTSWEKNAAIEIEEQISWTPKVLILGISLFVHLPACLAETGLPRKHGQTLNSPNSASQALGLQACTELKSYNLSVV